MTRVKLKIKFARSKQIFDHIKIKLGKLTGKKLGLSPNRAVACDFSPPLSVVHDVCTIPHRRSTVLHRRLSYASSLPTSLRRPLPAKEHGEVSFLVAASSLAEDNPAATLYRRWASPPSPSVPNRTTAMLFAASTVCRCLSLACVMKPQPSAFLAATNARVQHSATTKCAAESHLWHCSAEILTTNSCDARLHRPRPPAMPTALNQVAARF